MENRALGKGLSALIPDRIRVKEQNAEEPEVPLTDIAFIQTAKIADNAYQPRINYDEESLDELKQSIKEQGVLQPILVRKKESGYEVVAGERRLRAARSLNLDSVPAVIRNISDEDVLILALVENIQRENLNPIEEAKAFKRLMEDFSLNYEEVAQAVGKDRSTISNSLRLLKLPELIRNALTDKKLSMGHARALLAIEDPDEQGRVFEEVVNKQLSVRDVESIIQQRRPAVGKRGRKKKDGMRHHEIVALEEELQRVMGTKVRILAKKNRGKIMIEYYSSEDFERLLSILKS